MHWKMNCNKGLQLVGQECIAHGISPAKNTGASLTRTFAYFRARPKRSLTNILNCRVVSCRVVSRRATEPLKPHSAQPADIAQLRIVADRIGAALARQE